MIENMLNQCKDEIIREFEHRKQISTSVLQATTSTTNTREFVNYTVPNPSVDGIFNPTNVIHQNLIHDDLSLDI